MRRVFSIKRWLLHLNLDLVSIEEKSHESYSSSLSHFEKLVIVLEDRRFLHHNGIDWRSLLRILTLQVLGKRKGGASTIEMQYVRTVLGNREITISRKVGEMIRAWLLNFRQSKKTTLESYLDCAFFGSRLHGARSASLSIYGCDPSRLSSEQAACLAAMLVYPRPLHPDTNWEKRVLTRAKYGLKLLARLEERLGQVKRT